MTSFIFAIDSDLHFDPVRSEKKDNAEHIINSGADFLIVTGDMTKRGTDGNSLCCFINGGKDHLSGFMDDYYEPISKRMPVYLCAGNHDNWVPWPYIYKPVINLIKEKHGSLTYSFDHKGVHFACCHIYPDDDVLKWLAKDLDKVIGPIILFFHYNLNGPYSDWWARDKNSDPKIVIERQSKFYRVIKNKNVKLIITGHRHVNSIDTFKPVDESVEISTIVTGGPGFALCRWDGENISVRFMV